MGVKGLLRFAESPYVRAASSFTLSAEAHEYMNLYGKRPLLVCDGSALLHKFFANTPCSTIYGGQWIEYRKTIGDFVDKLRSHNIDLLFVFDGKIEEEKKSVWFQRRTADHERNCKIFEEIRKTGREGVRRGGFVLPASAQYSTVLVLKSLGVEVMLSFTDADAAVAYYARERDAFGVMTNDSDLLIYNCKCPVFTTGDLQLFTLKTTKISAEKLCHHLNIQLCDLPLLACLVGNDRIPHHMLERFHHRINNRIQGMSNQESLISSVASYIADCKFYSKTAVDIANEVFHNPNRNIIMMFLRALGQYVLPPDTLPWLRNIPPMGPGNWTGMVVPSPWGQAILPPHFLDLIERKALVIDGEVLRNAITMHTAADMPPAVLNILIYNHYECSSSLEDRGQEDLPSIRMTYKEVRKRVYGLLLGSCVHAGASVCEWHGDKFHNVGVSEENVIITIFSSEDLGNLWLSPRNPKLDNLKTRTFLKCCSCEGMMFKLPQLLSLPPHLFILCSLLHYLFYKVQEDSFIKTQEVEAFIAQAISPARNDISEIRDVKIMPRPRAVNLASIFVRGIAVLGIANAACGSPLPPGAFSPVHLFDGVLFHKKYMQTLHNINDDILCDKDRTTVELYRRLKHVVYTCSK